MELVIQEDDTFLKIYREDDLFIFDMSRLNIPDEKLSVSCDISDFLRLIQKL